MQFIATLFLKFVGKLVDQGAEAIGPGNGKRVELLEMIERFWLHFAFEMRDRRKLNLRAVRAGDIPVGEICRRQPLRPFQLGDYLITSPLNTEIIHITATE